MKILLDDNKQIIAFAKRGNLNGAIKVNEEIVPDDFELNFASGYYLFDGATIVRNPSYVPFVEDTTVKPGITQQAITLITQMLSAQDQQIKSLEQSITLLAKGGK